MSSPLIIRLRIGHDCEIFQHTPTVRYKYSLFVRAYDGSNFSDNSMIQWVSFTVHQNDKDNKGYDQECMRVEVAPAWPPFKVTGISPEDFPTLVTIRMDGRTFKFTYNVTMSAENSTHSITETVYLKRSSPDFYSNAKRFGADNVVRSNECGLIGLPGLTRSSSLEALDTDLPTEKRRRLDREKDEFPICDLPYEIIMMIFDRLPTILDRWRMRLNKRLLMLEKLGRPMVPSLTITSSPYAEDDGTTLRSPLNLCDDYGKSGAAFVKRLEKLSLYPINTLHLSSFMSKSDDAACRESYVNFRRDVYRAIGMITAHTVISDYAYMTMGDFRWAVNSKRRFVMVGEHTTMFSKGYLNVAKKIFNGEIECRYLAMPVGKNEGVFGWLWRQIESEPLFQGHVQRVGDRLEMNVRKDHGIFKLVFSCEGIELIPNLAPCHFIVEIE